MNKIENENYKKMINCEVYDLSDNFLKKTRDKTHKLFYKYNNTHLTGKRKRILDKLIPQNNNVYLEGPIYIDYGINTSFGKNCYANFNLTILDTCLVTIGDNVFIGPNVSIVTSLHPLKKDERRMYANDKGVLTDREMGKPINIENDVWICSNVVICGGVTIGSGAVIGAGSVVTKDIPENVFAAGNPCKEIKKINC
ncbi:MAG: sugar O-acetyltransferase [Bacilli bacterium]|nr:sugar O-acetyltransferase [Bacilli bacterium]